MQLIRDHTLPPDPESYRRADHPNGRIIVIAPTRASCETIELAVQTHVDTLLQRKHGETLTRWAVEGKSFGIVAGTGTGKTLGIRIIAEAILQRPLRVGVVNREREATPETDLCNVVIVTTGIARRWFTDDLIGARDTVIVDEIHQTSAELELCLALGKRAGCRFIWLSATVDASFFKEYLEADEVLETSAFDPALRAQVTVEQLTPADFLNDRTVRRFISERRGVAVFLPTRVEVERLGEGLGSRFPKLHSAFYHGGEPIRVIRPFLDGEIKKPYLLAMTAAGQSALNLPGLDTVVIYDARYSNVVDRGRNVLHRLYLGANEILQMAGRVHGRVKNGEVTILSDRRIDFDHLRPVPPEFQLAGDAERVALTCAAIGVVATDLDLPVPLDREAYRNALTLLSERGLIDNGRLTRYGRDVEALPVERPWSELLIHADAALLPIVAAAAGIESLHRMTREERELHGVVVPGSDHLTAYQLMAEAVNEFGSIAEVHGLKRYVFDEEALARWSERRGVLMKAVEDASLAMASVYRSLDVELPKTLPRADKTLRADFIDLLARVAPFALVIDEMTANGQEARIGKTSVAMNNGAIAGPLRYFADRMGVPRASIEGTTIPFSLVRKYAVWGNPTLVISGSRQQPGLALAQRQSYFGFQLEQNLTPIRDEIPVEWQVSARELLADALIGGTVEHPSRSLLNRSLWTLRGYWNRAGGLLPSISDESLRALLLSQLEDVKSWQDFLDTPLSLDVDALIPHGERERLDALPKSIRLQGDMVPISYQIRDGVPVAILTVREGQARRMSVADLPTLDRPLHLAVHQGDGTIEAPTIEELLAQLRQSYRRGQKPGGRRPEDDRDTRGGRGGNSRRGGKGGPHGKNSSRDKGRRRR